MCGCYEEGGVEVQLHSFVTLALDTRWVVSFTPWPLGCEGKDLYYAV